LTINISPKNITEEQKAIILKPIFIVGAGRSGTTWLQRLLLENTKIIGGQETHFFRFFNDSLESVINASNDSRQVGLSTYWSDADFYMQIRNIWLGTFQAVINKNTNAKILIEKTPNHVLNMDTIKKVLPNAKFIHLIRDSRSVVSSLLSASKGWGAHWAPNDTKSAAITWWYKYVLAGRASSLKLSSYDYIEIHYEDLLANPVTEIIKIYEFMGIDYDIENIKKDIDVQAFSKQKKEKGTGLKTAAGDDLKEPDGFIRKGQADSWKQELNIFQKLVVWRYTRKLMRECGYDWNGRVKIEEDS